MKKSTCFAVMLLLLSSASYAMERFEIVTTQELKQMLDDGSAGELDFILENSLMRSFTKVHPFQGLSMSHGAEWTRSSKGLVRIKTS